MGVTLGHFGTFLLGVTLCHYSQLGSIAITVMVSARCLWCVGLVWGAVVRRQDLATTDRIRPRDPQTCMRGVGVEKVELGTGSLDSKVQFSSITTWFALEVDWQFWSRIGKRQWA